MHVLRRRDNTNGALLGYFNTLSNWGRWGDDAIGGRRRRRS